MCGFLVTQPRFPYPSATASDCETTTLCHRGIIRVTLTPCGFTPLHLDSFYVTQLECTGGGTIQTDYLAIDSQQKVYIVNRRSSWSDVMNCKMSAQKGAVCMYLSLSIYENRKWNTVHRKFSSGLIFCFALSCALSSASSAFIRWVVPQFVIKESMCVMTSIPVDSGQT